MNRLLAVQLFAFLASLVLAVPASAADLQDEWYVKVGAPAIVQYDAQGYDHPRWGDFRYTPPGQYGPFLVTDGTYHNSGVREVYVPANAYGVDPSASLDLPIWFGLSIGDPIGYLAFAWYTNYDPQAMRLELWRTRSGGTQELVWTQGLSGVRSGSVGLLQDTSYEGQIFLRVAVIPEPSSASALVAGLLSLMPVCLHRRKTCVR